MSDMSRKALKMEHRVTSRYFVRETCRKGSNTEEFERHVMAGSGNGAFYRVP
jgi:hypothetical protein